MPATQPAPAALGAGLTDRPAAGKNTEEANCQRLYEQYKTLIGAAVKAGDKDEVARLTDAFDASVGGRLLYVRVSRIDAPDKVTALLSKPFGKRRVSLPNIHYAFSTKPHVTRQEDPAGAYMLVETNSLGGGENLLRIDPCRPRGAGHGAGMVFDLWEANRRALEAAGVRNIEGSGICTACHNDRFFSCIRASSRSRSITVNLPPLTSSVMNMS